MKKACSIIIPIFNEGRNIIKLIKLIKKNFRNKKFEIIFVDDNSNDETHEILQKLKDKKIHFIIRKKKNDLTQSCFDGIRKSKFTNLIIMDGDLQHHPKYLNKIYNLFIKNNKDLVVCSRSFKKRESLSMIRYISSITIISIINILFGHRVDDPMSGYFIFKKKIFTQNQKKFYGRGYKILFDFIYSCQNLNLSEIKIKFYKRTYNRSKMNIMVIMHIIFSMIHKIFRNLK